LGEVFDTVSGGCGRCADGGGDAGAAGEATAAQGSAPTSLRSPLVVL
jgi:hypothetical protein